MEKVSDVFYLQKNQKELDFADVNLNSDNKLFIAPGLVSKSTDVKVAEIGSAKIINYFDRIFSLMMENDLFNVRRLCSYSNECNATKLGYSVNKSIGRGVSEQNLNKLFNGICKLSTLLKDNNENPMYLFQPDALKVFVYNFGPDRLSDLVTSIIKKELVEYSLSQAKKYGLPISFDKKNIGFYWDMELHDWREIEEHVIMGPGGDYLLLVPKQILTSEKNVDTRKFVQNYVFKRKQSEHLANNSSLCTVKKLKNGKIKVFQPSLKTLWQEEVYRKYKNKRTASSEYALNEVINNRDILNIFYNDMVNEKIVGLSDDELTTIIERKNYIVA